MKLSETNIELPSVRLKADIEVPHHAKGLIIFVHGSGSSRLSLRNKKVAGQLTGHHFATLLFDLLTEAEDEDYESRFDIKLLTSRLIEVTLWAAQQHFFKGLPIGYFGASTGAAAALSAAAELQEEIEAVVSRGGRPDLATEPVSRITAPTLFIVGENDADVLELNRKVYLKMETDRDLQVIAGAGHLFEEPGTMDQVVSLSTWWFRRYLVRVIQQ